MEISLFAFSLFEWKHIKFNDNVYIKWILSFDTLSNVAFFSLSKTIRSGESNRKKDKQSLMGKNGEAQKYTKWIGH